MLKYPQLTPLFSYLHQLLPEAKFVISLRDTRDGGTSAVASQQESAPVFANANSGQIAAAIKKLERFAGIDLTVVDPHDAPATAGYGAPATETSIQ